jgi:hypothetical protein
VAFLHDLEQRALDLGRGAIDLVGEQQVREDGAQRCRELTGLLVVHPGPDEVGGDEVRRELDPLELAADRGREGLDRHCLGQAGDALDQDVAASQQRDDEPLEEVVWPTTFFTSYSTRSIGSVGSAVIWWSCHPSTAVSARRGGSVLLVHQ